MGTLSHGRTLSEAMVLGPTKKLLSVSIFRLAKDALTRCKRSKAQPPVMGILEVYILTVAALEALINEICLEKIDQRREAKKSVSQLKRLIYADDKGHYMDNKRKYDELPEILWNESFDRGSLLWNDFGALIRLRNDIVHYTPEWEEPGYVPDYLRPIYQRILPRLVRPSDTGSFLANLLNSQEPLINIICNVAMGKWAFDTGKNMIRQLLTLWNPRDPLREDYIIMFESSGIRFSGVSL